MGDAVLLLRELLWWLTSDLVPPLALVVRATGEGRDPVREAWPLIVHEGDMRAVLRCVPDDPRRYLALNALEAHGAHRHGHLTGPCCADAIRRVVPHPPTLSVLLVRPIG